MYIHLPVLQDLKVDALSCTINAKGTIANSAVKVDMDIDATVGGLKQSVKLYTRVLV